MWNGFHYSSRDGLCLHARIYGEGGNALPAICLPGLTRNARDFHDLAVHLSRNARTRRRVVAFDYRGRGRSQYDPNWRNYDVAVESGDIIDGLVALDIPRGAFIGTSRGGLIAMALAALRPSLLGAVILNDVGPVIEGEGLARIRTNVARAPQPTTMEDAILLARATHGAAFPALTDADWARMTASLYRQEAGKIFADHDPALGRSLADLDLNVPLPVLWPQFLGLSHIPLLAIRGQNSTLLSANTLVQMQECHPNCETIVVEGQGHPPLLETAGLPQRIEAFLERADGQRHDRAAGGRARRTRT